MGEKTITTQVKIDGEIVPDFSFDWEVEFQGEKYIMPLRIPQGAKENTSLKSAIDLTFQHWAIYQLKRWPFVTIQQIAAGTYLPDEEVATVQLNLKDFCILFGQVLEYYYGGAITIDLNPAWQYDSTPTVITISHTLVWNVLIDAFHDKYGVRWAIEPAAGNSNTTKGGERYVIKVGYPTTEVDHIFEYGFEGGLLKLERQVQSEEIRNMLKGRGGDTNIPFRYFKNTDSNNPDFKPDPDWVNELANIYFPNLMGATFRSYVQGWKAAHLTDTDEGGNLLYEGYTPVSESNAYAPWAYRKGYTDIKFQPVEFVANEITINPTSDDKQVEILPGYSPYVKKDSSLDKYGPLSGTLDNNDDIYPTIQGTGLDIAVDVEQIESDDVEEAVESDAQENNVGTAELTMPIAANLRKGGILTGKGIYIPEGQYGNFDPGTLTIKVTTKHQKKVGTWILKEWQEQEEDFVIQIEDISVSVYDNITNEEHSASGIPAGSYYYEIHVSLYNTLDEEVKVTISCETPQIKTATIDGQWKNTFDIWVKNIWESTKLSTETDTQYAERVWKPVLGDRENNTAKVVFTSGALVHEDYEFTIVGFPVPDSSKSYEGAQSHWRIKLAKSDAELEATGLYVPSPKKQGKAGDTFVFIGTEMTHVPYVTDAEIRLDDWKKDQLGEVKEIKPTFVVTTDRVRLNNEGEPDALINQLRVGNSIRLADKRFIQTMGDRAYETIYLQSITYTYREPSSDDAALNPDVEIVLGDEYTTSANPVSMMQGEISALQRQVGSISNVEQIVRAVGDKLYLRKDGISDRSLSPTQFFSLLTSGDFRAGLVGGTGWGAYKDENNNWVIEADRINARQEMQVNSLVINQVTGRGGMIVESASQMNVSKVIETDSGYICYFDQKDGSVANLFHIDDVAYCQRWTPENGELKFYKRRVIAVDVNSITLTKERNDSNRPANWPDSGVNGNGIPTENDNIIHFGNYNDSTRQYVKVRDVIGGGYERYIESLDSVTATGVEYYFVGKQDGQAPRWFIGHEDTDYAEWKDGVLRIKGTLSLQSNVGDLTLSDLVGLKYLQEALPQSTDIMGGLVLTSLIRLGLTDDSGNRVTHSGVSGLYDPLKRGGGISSWWGGEMLDKFDYYTYEDNIFTPIPDKDIPDNIAAGIVRFDGTGYFANGNFWWDNQGIIRMNPKTLFLNLDIDGLDSGSLEQNLKKIYAEIIKLTSLFEFDETEKYIKAKHGVVFPYGAAFYEGEPGGGGGTGGGLIQKVYDYSDLSGSFDNSTLTDTFNAYTIAQLAARLSTQENAGYVTSAQLASALIGKADKATTLAGYGITDGVTQTGLSSALAGYSTKTEVANTYLPLSGGTLTGQVVISPSIKGGNLVVAGSELGAGGGQTSLTDDLPKYASYFGTFTIGGTWYNVLSLRHRNGAGDGDKYGMYLYTNMTSGGNLVWNKQTYGTIWQGERTLLDSANFNSYAPTKTGDGATGTWGISITGNAATATAAQAVINGGSVNPLTFNTNTENTTDSWLLVQKGTEIQHRNMTTLSVASAASAANSDTLDGLHAAAFGRRYVLGTTTDAQMGYVLLGKAYTSGAAITGFAVTGTLYFNRGGGVLEHDRVDIVASAQYINNAARWAALGTHAEAYRTVLVTYQGARWIAVERNIIQAVDVTFEGVAMNGAEFHLVTASQVSDVVAFGDNTLYTTATNARALNTTRYLWGRPFKGDDDVSGALTGVTEITNSGRYLSTNSGVVGTNGFQCQGGGVDATFGINPATGGPYIWVASAHALRFATSGAERMRITADGKVGIGTTDPTAALHIVGASAHVHLDSADGYPYFTFYTNNVAKGTVGHNPTYGAYIKNNDGNHRIFILNDSTVGVLKADSTIAYRIAVDSNNNITITPAGGQITLNANVRINGKTTFVNG